MIGLSLVGFRTFSFFAHLYFPASGQAVVTGVVPSPPRFLPSILIAHTVQQSHCSSIFISSTTANSRSRAFRKSICAQEKVPAMDNPDLIPCLQRNKKTLQLRDRGFGRNSFLQVACSIAGATGGVRTPVCKEVYTTRTGASTGRYGVVTAAVKSRVI